MTLASSLVQIDPRGTELAGFKVGGKEHLAVVLANASGHILDTKDTWWVGSGSAAFAQNKHFLSGLNASGSGKVVKLRRLVLVNQQLAAVTGVAVAFEIKKITAHSGGTALTPVAADSADAALPAQVTFRTGATSVTEGAYYYVYCTNNDEVGAAGGFTLSALQVVANLAFDDRNMQSLTFREGEGFTMKMVTATTVGSYGAFAVFTIE